MVVLIYALFNDTPLLHSLVCNAFLLATPPTIFPVQFPTLNEGDRRTRPRYPKPLLCALHKKHNRCRRTRDDTTDMLLNKNSTVQRRFEGGHAVRAPQTPTKPSTQPATRVKTYNPS